MRAIIPILRVTTQLFEDVTRVLVTYEIFPNTFSTNTLIAYLPSLSSDVTRARDDVDDTETTFRARDDVGDA